jgi:hypothetical protein
MQTHIQASTEISRDLKESIPSYTYQLYNKNDISIAVAAPKVDTDFDVKAIEVEVNGLAEDILL